MWTFNSANGALSHDGKFLGAGYSGRGAGFLNPVMANKPDVGPIPQGYWKIGDWYDDPEKGPVVCRLIADVDTTTFDRSGFMIHGDNSAHDHSASEGCIILPHALRELMRDTSDRLLFVA